MPTVSLALDTPELADQYERLSSDRQFKAGKALVERLAIQPGERVLDVGCGTGLLAEYVAQRVGPHGSVLGIDPLPLRIAIASRKQRPNLRFAVAEAGALAGVASESVDVVYLNAVFHWLPEKLGPLAEIHRVLVPGGRLGISTGSGAHLNTVQALRRKVLSGAAYKHYPEAANRIGHHVSESELKSLLEHADFALQEIALAPHVLYHDNADAALTFTQASSFGNSLGHLPEPLRSQAYDELKRELQALATADGIRQEGTRIVAIATRR